MKNRLLSIVLATFFLPRIICAQSPEKPAQQEIQVKKGQYIRDTAEKTYGHHDFDGLIILYNHLAAGRATFSDNQRIMLPPIGQIFREAKMDPAYLEIIDELIAISTEYQDVARQYFEVASKADLKALRMKDDSGLIQVPVSEDTKSKAADLERRLTAVQKKLVSGLKKGHSSPNSLLRNLEGARGYLKTVASGMVDENCYDVDMVSQRLEHAFTNALIWTRENYQ
jgi:hypothetical protein